MRATTTLLENNRIMLTVEIDDAEMDGRWTRPRRSFPSRCR